MNAETETKKTEDKSGVLVIKKDTLWKYSAIVLAALVVILLIFFVLPGKSPTGQVVGNNAAGLPAIGEKVNVQTGNAPMMGDAEAPVQIVEFTDYECPFCQRHSVQTLPLIKSNFIDTGKVSYVVMDFPLTFHANAQKAAEAAHCARAQGGDEAYFEMHDTLFANHQLLGVENYIIWAGEMGLNVEDFTNCLMSGEFAAKVQQSLQHGSNIGVSGTPGFFVNGRMISGACPYSVFESAINAELNGQDWGVTSCQFRLA